MRPLLFQYQARAEPVFVPTAAEEITLDKWDPGETRVRRPPPSSRASIVPSFFFLEDIAAAPEVVTLDKWYQPISVPGQKRRRDSYQAFFFLENLAVAPAPPLDSWYRPTSEPRRFRRGIGISSISAGTLVEFNVPVPPAPSVGIPLILMGF